MTSESPAKLRFPLELDIVFEEVTAAAQKKTGRGRTKDISSSGCYFLTDEDSLEASTASSRAVLLVTISWPAHVNSTRSMKLVVNGLIVRKISHGDKTGYGVHFLNLPRWQIDEEPGEIESRRGPDSSVATVP